MAFERPTLAKLIKRALSDVSTRLTGAFANLRGSPEQVLAIVVAGLTHGLHGHLKWLSKQFLADSAEDEFLVRLAAIFGVDRLEATAAAGELTITGTSGVTIPAGTVWTRADGATYTVDADVTLALGTIVAAVTAEEAGVDGGCEVGDSLTIATPIAGVTSTATVSGDGIINGSDIETITALRARLLDHLRTPPSGGGPGDYVKWAKLVTGVTRAWEYPLQLGAGTVVLLFVRDDDADIIPSAGEVADVQAMLDLKAPVTAEPTAAAVTALTVPFVFTALSPDTAAVRAAVEAELEGLFASVEPGVELELSVISEAISIAAGETSHTMTSPSANVVPTFGQLPRLGSITWP